MKRAWHLLRFGLIERYVFRMAFSACLLATFVLTAVIWVTQALRELDLMTSKGQTILMFLAITGLTIPALIVVIAPVALFGAVVFTLNKLNSDSELIVMSAAGTPPARILKPLAVLGVLVMLTVGWLTIVVMPSSFKTIRDLITKVQADFLSNVVAEGQFSNLQSGVTFHYRERSGQTLRGVFMQDRRDKDKTNVYLAERGHTVTSDEGSFLVLEKGSVQRLSAGEQDAAIVVFERYAIDLSELAGQGDTVYYRPREQSTWQLAFSPPFSEDKRLQARYRTELHDRMTAPLYPIAFMLIAYAALSAPRTTRQGRGAAIAAAIAGVVALRVGGFLVSSLVTRSAAFAPLAYVLPVAACLLALYAARHSHTLGRSRFGGVVEAVQTAMWHAVQRLPFASRLMRA
ncbi:MAG: LPS export ABC transporter permease LptF [Beijerinckiaceae bacterium]